MHKFPFADFNQINNQINLIALKNNEKLAYIHAAIGGKFHDDDQEIMTGSAAAIVAIGGFPIELDLDGHLSFFGQAVTVNEMKEKLYQTVGLSSFMSYLNPKNKSLNEIADTTIGLGHYSVLHQIQLSVLLTGISIGVEHEFSTQRDIVHLSRITVAKTKAQNSPCLVLRNPQYLEVYKQVLKQTKDIIKKSSIDDHETRNLLFPAAKASGLVITGSLRNLLKLTELKNAGGKEDEFVEALTKIEQLVKELFPEIK